jgi:hypothetical protein
MTNVTERTPLDRLMTLMGQLRPRRAGHPHREPRERQEPVTDPGCPKWCSETHETGHTEHMSNYMEVPLTSASVTHRLAHGDIRCHLGVALWQENTGPVTVIVRHNDDYLPDMSVGEAEWLACAIYCMTRQDPGPEGTS